MIRLGDGEVTPEQFVSALRCGMNESNKYFKQGGCYELFILMRTFWKEAEAWYDPIEGHVYTKIGDYWYDIDGKHHFLPERSHVMCRREVESAHRWSWGRLRPKITFHWGELNLPPINLLNVPKIDSKRWYE